MKLPECHSRRELAPGASEFFCAHPQVSVPGNIVRAEICRLCPLWREPPPEEFRPFPPPVTAAPLRGPCFYLGEATGLRDCPSCQGNVRLKVFDCQHPLHVETTLQECRTCPDFDDRLAHGGVQNWSVGVTTAPRATATLERTLAGLAAAGWPEPRIFAEPESEIPAAFAHLPLTRREGPLGAWPNFFLALGEMVLRDPNADAYFLLQDDVLLCRNLRAYLEQILWPAENLAFVSPYCPSIYVRRSHGLHAVEKGWSLVGALTCIFPNAAARALLSHARAVNFRQRGPNEGKKNVDSVLGLWAQTARLPIYFHTPSLAQHIGQTSVVWPKSTANGRRRASDFVGESFDASTLRVAELVRVPEQRAEGAILPLPPGEGRGRNGTHVTTPTTNH